ncbi:hypothetical protein HA052_20780 [Chromobacterium haemolyticum]|uniref:Lipoprotein n=1 Tax=Chromobacterium fluminis TaxID=3044269 RepID=A0ABX0L742_9NEIS|nr:hypothetical protein [Chromobacterium haemolyticum]NHR07627.1 hypothetical protein [Chromobacterium haemolyticum]
MKKVVIVLLGLAGVAVLVQIGTVRSDAPAHQQEESRVVSVVESSAPASQPNLTTSAPEPAHYYEFEDNWEYGYKMPLPEGGQKIISVRYMGLRDGVPVFYWQSGPEQTTMKCKHRCAYANVKSYLNGYLGSEETIEVAAGSPAWEMVEDAKAGRLKAWYSTFERKAPKLPATLSSEPGVNTPVTQGLRQPEEANQPTSASGGL